MAQSNLIVPYEMGSFKMKNVHRFDFSNLSNDLICDDDGDDEISDDEVFIRDSHGNHHSEENGVHKPLMAPRHKNHTKDSTKLQTRVRRVPSLRVLLAPLCYCCVCIAAFTGIVGLIIYLVRGFGFYTRSHTVIREVPFSSCSNVKVQDVWAETFPMLGTESAFRLIDLNNDDILDVILGFSTGVASYHYPKITCDIYFNGIKECGGGVLALDGKSGAEIWRHYTENEIFALNCNVDVDLDGIADCIAGGRVATLVAISGQNGSRIWTFNDPKVRIERSNVYTPQYIHDVDGDGLGDLIVMHGGDPLKKPGEKHDLAARIIVMSSRSGKVIKWVKVPDGYESYYSPQLITQQDGTEILLFGTGGETHGGSLWYIQIKDLLSGHMSMCQELYRDKHKGIMVPPALVDVTSDGVMDIIMTMFNSTVIAFDGMSFQRLWNFSFSESESYSTPGVGFFNDDDTADVIVNYQEGPGFPVYYFSQTTILDGKTGRSLFPESIKSQIAVQSSPLVISMQGYGNDGFLFWQSSCHGFENTSSKFEFLKGTSIHKQTRVNICKERFNSDEFYSQLYLTSKTLGQPGIIIYDSDQRKELEYSGNLNYTKIGLDYVTKHPGAKDLYKEQIDELYDNYSDEDVRQGIYGDYENLPDDIISNTREEIPNIPNPYSESQMNVQYPAYHNVRKHGRYGQDRNWRIHPQPKENVRHRSRTYSNSYANKYPHGNVYYPPLNDYEMGDGEDFTRNQKWKMPSEYNRQPPRHQFHESSNPSYSYNKQRPQNHYERRKWSSSRGSPRSRLKRHVGYHDGEGIQRIISTGTLAPTWTSNDNSSIDVIFATYWFHPQKALTILPEDKKCIKEKMKDESDRFRLYKQMDHDEYEEKVTVDCLKKSGRYVEGSDVLEEPPYDPFNISMGMMTVYRLRISCTCPDIGNSSKTTYCANVLPWSQQGWPSYMGRYGNSYFVPKTNYL